MRILIILAALAFTSPALASELAKDVYHGTTTPEVQVQLKAMGYEVRKSEMEDGEIEVYFVKDGKIGEVHVSTETGKITKVEMK